MESLEWTYILERNDDRKKNRQNDSDCSRSAVIQLHSLVNIPVEPADDDFALAIDDQNRGNHDSRRALSPLQNMSLLFRIPPSASFSASWPEFCMFYSWRFERGTISRTAAHRNDQKTQHSRTAPITREDDGGSSSQAREVGAVLIVSCTGVSLGEIARNGG